MTKSHNCELQGILWPTEFYNNQTGTGNIMSSTVIDLDSTIGILYIIIIFVMKNILLGWLLMPIKVYICLCYKHTHKIRELGHNQRW